MLIASWGGVESRAYVAVIACMSIGEVEILIKIYISFLLPLFTLYTVRNGYDFAVVGIRHVYSYVCDFILRILSEWCSRSRIQGGSTRITHRIDFTLKPIWYLISTYYILWSVI